MDLKYLFRPSTMAVIGVSTSQDNHPANVIYNKNHFRYPVTTFPVNPKGGLLNRETLYHSVKDIQEDIDMAVIAVRAEFVPKVVEECIQKGVRGAVIVSGGFAEAGNLLLQQRVADIAGEAAFPFIGPNCLGIYSPDHVDTFFLPGERIIRPDKGNIGLVSQSGGVLVDQMVKFSGQGIGLSLAVSIGNKAYVRETDMLDWFEQDLGTKVIAFYIEGFEKGEGRTFIKKAEQCSKPVVILKAGKSKMGSEAVSSHTASLAGDYRVFSEIMKQHCVAEAENEYELTSFCEALSCYPKGIAGNIGILSLSGGHGVIAADACELHGISIPMLEQETVDRIKENLSPEIRQIASLVNPMDLTGSSNDSDIVIAATHLSRDKNVECLLALLLPYSPGVSTDIGAKLSQVARNEGKPMIAYVPKEDKYKIIIEGFELNNIPVASSVDGGGSDGKGIKEVQTMLKETSQKILDNSKSFGWVLEPDAKALMKLQGLDIPEFVLTNDFEEADRFLKDLDSPVVVKAVSRKILHKTEHQAVVTGICSSDHLKTEMARLQKLDGCENILVEQMVQGLEVIIGAKNDYQFGPVIVFGIGGTSVEIYNDTAIRMAPLKPGDVYSMVESLKAKEIIAGYRGKAGVNMQLLTYLMVNFSYFIMEFENDIESVDLNPVICTPNQCVIADARIIMPSFDGSDASEDVMIHTCVMGQ